MRRAGGALLLLLFAGGGWVQRAGGDEDPATDAQRADALAEEVRRLREELDAARARIAELETALADAHGRRAARELAWYEYNRTLALLSIDDRVPPFDVDPELVPPPEPPAALELERRLAERAREIQVGLRHLLLLEEIRGIDLLEVGTLDAGTVGPVVFRLLDDHGRLAGGLTAERMRLEKSRAGHTVTLVLENGFESRGGERIPFESGVRRIVLPFVDPDPWLASFPELFPAEAATFPLDDGRWSRARVQDDLNALLREAGRDGWWRLDRVEAILGTTLQLVQLERHGKGGALERRVFADRLEIRIEDGVVCLVLKDGVVVRGSARTPFVDGVQRIYLPSADVERWRAASLPGLGEPPEPGGAPVGDGRSSGALR